MGSSGPQSVEAKRSFNIVVIMIAVVLVIGAACAVVVSKERSSARDTAKIEQLQGSVRAIQRAIGTYASSYHVFPPASKVNDWDLEMAGYWGVWPGSPYIVGAEKIGGYPMRQGTGPGDFKYVVSADGKSYTIEVYGRDGKIVAKASKP